MMYSCITKALELHKKATDWYHKQGQLGICFVSFPLASAFVVLATYLHQPY